MINIIMDGLEIEKEIKLYHKGIHACPKGYSFGPFVRDHYLVHFVLEGRGTYTVMDKTYEISKNEAFFIFPNEVTLYKADEIDPWVYCWIGFQGEKIKNILDECSPAINSSNPVIQISPQVMAIIKEIIHSKDTLGENLKLTSLLLMFLYELSQCHNDSSIRPVSKNYYVDEAIKYIQENYYRDISVQEIANYICINRSYLSRLFKEVAGMSPKGYLINYRMEKAYDLLCSSDLSIASVGMSVGYTDQFLFSKVFKRIKGISPSKAREFLQ